MVTEAQKLRFSRIAAEHLSGERTGSGIGTLGEKRLHATVKDFLAEHPAYQEVSVFQKTEAGQKAPKYVADLCVGKHLYEVQTGGFYPLAKKLSYYLGHTDCAVTVVRPVPARKTLYWMDSVTGETVKGGTSHRSWIPGLARELYWIAPHLVTGRVTLRVLVMDMAEYRILGKYGKVRSTRHERIPEELVDDVTFACAGDYAARFLPTREKLPSPFTAAEYAKATGIRGKATYGVLSLLCDFGLLQKEKEGTRAAVWTRTGPKASQENMYVTR